MAIAEVELNTITRSIRGAMGESAGQFRQAAASSSANLTKIVKDLSNTLAAQRRDTAELHNSIEESVHEAQQSSSRIDQLASAFQESISIQTQMLGQLSTIGRNVKILNDSTESFNRNVASMLTGQGGISSILSGGFGSMTNAVQNISAFAVGAGVTAGAGAIAGGMGGGKGVGESGSSSEAMSFFQSKGWSKEQSAGIVGNLQAESGKNLRTDAVGDSGQAYGIAQWHPDRQRKFQEVMGVPIRQSNFKQQLEFVQWELMNTEKRAGQMLKAASSAIEAARAVDYGYERSTHEHLGQRMANAVSLAKENPSQGATPGSTSSDATPVATSMQKPEVFQQGPVASETASRTDPGLTPHHINGGAHGGEGHGSGKLSGVNQAILDKFNQIQSSAGTSLNVTSGFRDPAHNAAVGGAKNSAHTRGNAVDVTFGGGIPETLKLIEAASKAGIGGIGVYRPGVLHFDTEGKRAWGPSYHADSIPDWAREAIGKHLGGGVGGKTPDAEPTATTPATTSQMQQMQTAAAGGGLGTGQAPAATPVEQPHISQAMTPTSAPVSSAQMLGMMSMMGGIPGMGGISGMLPMVASVAGMLQGLSSTMSNVDMVNQAAVSKQAQSETLEDTLFGGREPQNNTAEGSGVNISMHSRGEGYAYNHPDDTGWPDWASMIGGNHWEEMKNFKKNMWG